jgi:hypothetical protein
MPEKDAAAFSEIDVAAATVRLCVCATGVWAWLMPLTKALTAVWATASTFAVPKLWAWFKDTDGTAGELMPAMVFVAADVTKAAPALDTKEVVIAGAWVTSTGLIAATLGVAATVLIDKIAI